MLIFIWIFMRKTVDSQFLMSWSDLTISNSCYDLLPSPSDVTLLPSSFSPPFFHPFIFHSIKPSTRILQAFSDSHAIQVRRVDVITDASALYPVETFFSSLKRFIFPAQFYAIFFTTGWCFWRELKLDWRRW